MLLGVVELNLLIPLLALLYVYVAQLIQPSIENNRLAKIHKEFSEHFTRNERPSIENRLIFAELRSLR